MNHENKKISSTKINKIAQMESKISVHIVTLSMKNRGNTSLDYRPDQYEMWKSNGNATYKTT